MSYKHLKFLIQDLNTAQSPLLWFNWFLILVLVAEEILSPIIKRSTFIKKLNLEKKKKKKKKKI